MVGGGTNHASGLTQADVGIAIGSGTDVAMAPTTTLVSGDLPGVLPAIALSRAVLRTTMQSLFRAAGSHR